MQATEPYDLAKEIRQAPPETLVRMIVDSDPASQRAEAVRAEITLRNIAAAQETAQAQIDAARYTRDNARWMFWSIIVLAVTSAATLGWQIWSGCPK